MSSFIGIVNGVKELSVKIGEISGFQIPKIETPYCTIYADSSSDRLSYSENWIISGIGIYPYPNTALVSTADWNNLFLNDFKKISDLNGHFVGVKIDQQNIEIVSDQVGMRSLFIIKKGTAVIFSTRIDWLLAFSEKEINWKVVGENWLSVNAFSGKCMIDGILRIHSSAQCKIEIKSISYTPKSWTPTPVEIDLEDYLFKLSSAIYRDSGSISLGLSGGLDSRLLLAILAGNSNIDYDLYTFSGLNHPDEKIARKLNSRLNKTHHFIEHEVSEVTLESLGNVAVRSMLNSSIPEYQSFKLYDQIGKQRKKTIDGAIGEIARRRFYRIIEVRGKKALFHNDIHALSNFFYAPKAGIFNEDIKTEMILGYRSQLEEVISKMPDVQSFEIGNWLDLFTIRTRLINIAGMNQELSDEYLFHLMPFVQPDFLNGVFSLPISERSNAKLFRRIIKKYIPELSKYSLVKGDNEYPFWMNDLTSLVWMKANTKLGRFYRNQFLTDILLKNETQIRDLFSSSFFKEAGCYNLNRTHSLIHSFYNDNNYNLASELNWLLTFELFRKTIENESF